MTVITIGQHKGGVGKSTIAVNMAAELKRQGIDVLLVDADPRVKTSSRWQSYRQEHEDLPEVPCLQVTGRIHKNLQDAARRWEIIVVDVAGRDSVELSTALLASDLLLIPARPSQADIDPIVADGGVLDTVDGAQNLNSELKAALVFNDVSTNPNDRQEPAFRHELSKLDLLIAETRLHHRNVWGESLETGRGVVELANSKAKAEIQLLTKEALTWLAI